MCDFWYPDYELMVVTLFYTGMREGELLGLQWEDIDWSRNLIDLRRTVDVRKGPAHREHAQERQVAHGGR
jgi:integrase